MVLASTAFARTTALNALRALNEHQRPGWKGAVSPTVALATAVLARITVVVCSENLKFPVFSFREL